jgi:hypothetical protein
VLFTCGLHQRLSTAEDLKDAYKFAASFARQTCSLGSILPVVKWSTESGHQVKAVKCHNEVNNDNRKVQETELHERLQALHRRHGVCVDESGTKCCRCRLTSACS